MKYFIKTATKLPVDIGRLAVKLREMYPAMSKSRAVNAAKQIKSSLRPRNLTGRLTSGKHGDVILNSGVDRRLQVLEQELSGRHPIDRFFHRKGKYTK